MSKRTGRTKKGEAPGIEEKGSYYKGEYTSGQSGNNKTDMFYACPVEKKDKEPRKTRKNSSKPKKK